MGMSVEETGLEGVLLVNPELLRDERGFFLEVFRKDLFQDLGLPTEFVQVNQSHSRKGVIRGLHFQWDPPQGKMMRVVEGTAFVVAVDIRKGSPSLGDWFGVEISASAPRQLWAPAGFATGFCALSDFAQVEYLCTGIYNPSAESGILWSDPEIGITWPTRAPILSGKDRDAQTLAEWLARSESDHFVYEGGESR